jgi:hypothetical protein
MQSRYDIEAFVNISELEPGSVILQAQIEEICGISRQQDVELFRFHQMRIVQQLSKSLIDRGSIFTVCSRKCNIHVLTHAEASKYNQRAFRNGLKKSKRSTARLLGVDVAQLSPAEVLEHDRALHVQARTLSAISASMRGLPINVPGIKNDRINPIREGRPKFDMDRYKRKSNKDNTSEK